MPPRCSGGSRAGLRSARCPPSLVCIRTHDQHSFMGRERPVSIFDREGPLEKLGKDSRQRFFGCETSADGVHG